VQLRTVLLVLHLAKKQREEPRLSQLETGAVRSLVAQQDDRGYEKYIRFDREAFGKLASRFALIWERVPIKRSGKSTRVLQRKHTSKETLFLLLRLLAGNTPLPDLCVIAGTSAGALSNMFSHALAILLVVLRQWKVARVQAPTLEEAQELDRRVTLRYPNLHGFVGFADGAIKQMEDPGDFNFQEASYNGYYRFAATKDITLFLSDGCIGGAVINGVGTWSDMRLEPLLGIDQLLAHLPPQYLVAVDIGLPSTPRLIRGLSETELGAIPLARHAPARSAHSYLAKLRVAAEWGISGLYKEWAILVMKGYADDPVKRALYTEVCMRLHNVRCRLMDRSQIRTVFSLS